MDSALVEVLDKETGKVISYTNRTVQSLKDENGSVERVVRLASIKMTWSEWIELQAKREKAQAQRQENFEALLAERTSKLETIEGFFSDLTLTVRGLDSYRLQAPDKVVFSIDELFDWISQWEADQEVEAEEEAPNVGNLDFDV